MLFAIIALVVVIIVILTAVFKLHPFLSLLFGTFLMGIFSGMPLLDVVANVNEGFGNIMKSIGIVIVAGTIIGVILEKSGAAYRMAEVVLRLIGEKHPQLAMSIIGYIVSIPVFCDSGYVILSGLKKALAKRAKVAIASMAIALSTGLYATHTLVVPGPGPMGAAGNIGAENYLGTVILIGLIVAIPTAIVGYFWAVKVATNIKVKEDEQSEQLDYEELVKSFGEMPSTFKSFLPIVLPLVLIGIGSFASIFGEEDTTLFNILKFLGSPTVALLLGVLAAFLLLPNFSEETLSGWIGRGLVNAAPIILITGAAGAFGNVISSSGVAEVIENMNLGAFDSGVMFLLVPFIIAAALKTAQGSSTAALLITSSLIAPVLPVVGIEGAVPLALVIMAIGAGAMIVSHVNDSYFWVVTQFSGMTVQDAYKGQTMATLLQGITTIIVTMILWIILV